MGDDRGAGEGVKPSGKLEYIASVASVGSNNLGCSGILVIVMFNRHWFGGVRLTVEGQEESSILELGWRCHLKQ